MFIKINPPLSFENTQVGGNRTILGYNQLKQSLTDGRISSFFIERLVIKRFGLKKAKSEKMPFDAIQTKSSPLPISDGAKIEIRVITSGGTYLIPSGQKGKGRSFNQAEFFDKISVLSESDGGYLFVDTRQLPESPLLEIYYADAGTALEIFQTGVRGQPLKNPGQNISSSNFDNKVGDYLTEELWLTATEKT